MVPNSAWDLVNIVQGTDYSPTDQSAPMSPGGPSVHIGRTPPIFALLCTKGGTSGNIVIGTLAGNDITIPGAAFKQGVVYYIYLRKLISDNSGDVAFVGYQYRGDPLVY